MSFKFFWKGCKKGMKKFGDTISAIVNTVLLFIVYFFGVGLTWFFSRIAGKKFLETKISKEKSYWNDLNLKEKNIEEYYRQF